MARFKAEKVKLELTEPNMVVVGAFFKASPEDYEKFLLSALGEVAALSAQSPEGDQFGLFNLNIDSHGIKHQSSIAVASDAMEPFIERLLGWSAVGSFRKLRG